MRNIGLDYRSGIATAAITLPVFIIGYCILLVFTSSSIPTPFSALIITAIVGTSILSVLQSVWTKKTYIKRLQKTTRALEEISLGKPSEQLAKERYVLCSDIKQCPEDHTVRDCLNCDLYDLQDDLEKLGAIVHTLGGAVNHQQKQPARINPKNTSKIIELATVNNALCNNQKIGAALIRRDPGFKRPDQE